MNHIEAMKRARFALIKIEQITQLGTPEVVRLLSKAIEEAEKVEPYSSYVKSLESLVQDADAMFNGQNLEWGKRHLSHIERFAGIAKLPQREWVGLTDGDVKTCTQYEITRDKGCFHAGAIWAEAKLKEKNT